MTSVEPLKVASTDKTANLNIAVDGQRSVDEMESVLVEVASELDLHLSHVTTLGAKRYPGNRHWHFKHAREARGCLDVTYWPAGPAMWISMRHSEPAWVHESGHRLGAELKGRFAASR